MGRLEGKVAVITGTASGQGRAAALRFAQEGAKVVGCDVDVAGAESIVQAVRDAGGEMVSMHPCDLVDPEQAAALVRFAEETYGRIDVLYNNAAIARIGWLPEVTAADLDYTLNGEVTLVFNTVKAAWQGMIDRGGGVIINTASVSGSRVIPVLPGLAHSAGKGAVLSMTRHMALEGGKHNIRANSISPGIIEVPGKTGELLKVPEFRDFWKNKLLLSRWGQPEDVAGVAVFLASDDAAWMTGSDLVIDGGSSIW